eukprot:8234185-Pyramimonas_sp.AAC.1
MSVFSSISRVVSRAVRTRRWQLHARAFQLTHRNARVEFRGNLPKDQNMNWIGAARAPRGRNGGT